jgi:hypothetical protein
MICELCPKTDNEVPEAMAMDHMEILHPEHAAALNAHAVTLQGVYLSLREYAEHCRRSEEYREAYAEFDRKPLDPTRVHRFTKLERYVAGVEAAAHMVEHMIAEGVQIVHGEAA